MLTAHHAVHAGGQVAMLVAVEDLHFHHFAVLAIGQAQAGVFHFAALLAEDGAQQFLFRREFFLALRRDLADQNIVLVHFPHRCG